MHKGNGTAGAHFAKAGAAWACLLALRPNIAIFGSLSSKSAGAKAPFVEPRERWEGARWFPAPASVQLVSMDSTECRQCV